MGGQARDTALRCWAPRQGPGGPGPEPGGLLLLRHTLALLLLLLLLLLLQPHTEAGFACLSSPCVYGICMDDLNRCVCERSRAELS